MLEVLARAAQPLDDDQIARISGINRYYVNALCNKLAAEGLIKRTHGPTGKYENALVEDGGPSGPAPDVRLRIEPRRRRSTSRRSLTRNLDELVAGFDDYVRAFEQEQAFPGPSLYFHERAIELRRGHASPAQMLADTRFLEYVYAVLPAWGMHRMGKQAAKVGDFGPIVDALAEVAGEIDVLWQLRITALTAAEADAVAAAAWTIIERLKVSTSRTQIVAGSKFVHHLLPDLIPPIDRQYTFRFFTGQKYVPDDRSAFLLWYPRLAAVGARCQDQIKAAIDRRGFMATGEAKVVDNAIMGFMQQRRAIEKT